MTTAPCPARRRLAPGLLVAALAVLVMGCSQDPPPPAAPAVEAPAASVQDSPGNDEAAPGSGPAAPALPADAVTVDALADCSADQVTTVRWNASAFVSGPITIRIAGAPEGLFAQSGEPGEKQTGAWAAPGMTFLVTDAKERELTRVTAKSLVDCD